MGYPTTIAWRFSDGPAGFKSPVTITGAQGSSSGAQPTVAVSQNAGSTTQETRLGTTAKLADETYGEIEAIYLKGVASTAAGDAVHYDQAGATVRLITTSDATMAGPVAIALQPCVASQFGWYAIRGKVPVSTANAIVNESLMASGTAGQLTDANDTLDTQGNIVGMSTKSAQDGPGTGFTDVLLHYPWCWEK